MNQDRDVLLFDLERRRNLLVALPASAAEEGFSVQTGCMLGKRREVQPIVGVRPPLSAWKLMGWHRTVYCVASANRTPCVFDRPGDEVFAGDDEPSHEPVGIALGSLDSGHDVAFGDTAGKIGIMPIMTTPTHNGVSRTKNTILDEQVFYVVRTALHAPDGNEPNCG
jgi:hypothetical protein